MNQVTSASLRYPLSVFNKNSTLKTQKKFEDATCKDCYLTRDRRHQPRRVPGLLGGSTGPRWDGGPAAGFIKLEVRLLGGSRLSCHVSRQQDGFDLIYFKVGFGILQITSAKRCPQVWPCFGRSLFSTDFVEYDPAV